MNLKSATGWGLIFFALLMPPGNGLAQTEEEIRQLKEVLIQPPGLTTWKAKTDTLKAWLDDGGDPNIVLDGKSLLHWAVRIAKTPPAKLPDDIPESLKIDPFEKSMKDDMKRSKQIVELLLSSGADPDAFDDEKQTALNLAFPERKLYLVPALLKAGADPNPRDSSGFAPIHWAAMEVDMAMYRQLIEAGADPNAEDDSGSTVLEWFLQVEGASELSLSELIELGADPRRVGTSGWSPLMIAAQRSEPEWVRLLVKHGADSNAADNTGGNLIHYAVSRNFEKEPDKFAEKNRKTRGVIELLVKLGNDINEQNGLGLTPLHLAALENAPFSATVLAALGATPEVRDEEGNTPLHLALSENHQEVVESLLEQGAGMDAISKTLGSGLTIAARRFNEGRVEEADYLALLNLALEHAEEVEAADADGRTALHWAAASGFPEAVDALIEKGATIESADDRGQTPLMWAACANAADGIGRLVHHGADPMAKDHSGKTALDWAKELGQGDAVTRLEKAIEKSGTSGQTGGLNN